MRENKHNLPDYIIQNANIVNANTIEKGSVFIKDNKISKIQYGQITETLQSGIKTINATGKYLMPGVIDDQVHFREPGLSHKGNIYSESKAAVAGGITSFMEMPNTIPQSTTIDLLEEKYRIAAEKSLANYSFYIGATNNNLEELLKINPKNVCGIKIFMGSSTGNMLVNDVKILSEIFEKVRTLIAVHCEDDDIINKNTLKFKNDFGENVPIKHHPNIRSVEACYSSSSVAVELAKKYNTRLHILHLSTEKEIGLLQNSTNYKEKKITSEVCVHHLWFNDSDYEKYGTKIKWNPAIKKESDRKALIDALNKNTIDVIATDHAPHLIEEKQNTYFKASSGGPLVQHSLVVMLELFHKKQISLEKIVEKMCHTPAEIFNIDKRGYIKEGYWADLVLFDLNSSWEVKKDNILYKCNWSPFEGQVFASEITHTMVNGNLVYEKGSFFEKIKGKRLIFTQ